LLCYLWEERHREELVHQRNLGFVQDKPAGVGKARSGEHLKVGSLGETTMGEPAPVFVKFPSGQSVALFDRPGVGAKSQDKAQGSADAGTNFIAQQGLKWWTGVILLMDRSSVADDRLIYQFCLSVETPILVARNKVVEDLMKEQKEADFTGEPKTEQMCIDELRSKFDDIDMNGQAVKLVDTKFPERYQFKEVMAWMDELSRTPRRELITI